MNTPDNEVDRRSIYRIEPGEADGLSIAMVIDEQTLMAERVVNVTINGAAATFARRRAALGVSGRESSPVATAPEATKKPCSEVRVQG